MKKQGSYSQNVQCFHQNDFPLYKPRIERENPLLLNERPQKRIRKEASLND